MPAPTVDEVSSPTNENPIMLTGSGEAGLDIEVRGGAESVVSATVGGDGSFSVEVPLKADQDNTLLVQQVDGSASSESIEVSVTHDGMAPDTPSLDPVTTPTRRPMQELSGTAEAGATIVVSGGLEEATGTVGEDGSFTVEVVLETAMASITENSLEVVARDPAGNESDPASATIVHNPNLDIEAPSVDDVPRYTPMETLTITGTSAAGVTVSVSGGASPATTMAGSDGSFSVDVDLNVNAENNLSVFGVNPTTGMSSPPTSVVVTHDDIAPDSPSVDPEDSPTGAMTVDITGDSEPMATIGVTGGAADASGMADEDGAFAVDVDLAEDATNELEITATDRAGNESAPTTVVIEQDSSLPVPVDVDPVNSPTADNPITLTGSTDADAAIEVTGGATPAATTADGSGDFSVDVMLNANERNELSVSRAASDVDTIVVVTHDDVAPDAPSVNSIPSPTNRTEHDVTGSSEPQARISVSGGTDPAMGTAGSDGRFSVPVTIPEDTTTTLSVIATDRAGNSSSPTEVTVEHSSGTPDAPVVDEPNPAPTNMGMHTVTGHVTEPADDISIEISGGASMASGPTDPDTGTFSVDVPLQTNVTNELEVVAVQGGITSPAAIVTITHDDVAPDAPDGSAITVEDGSGLCAVRTGVSVAGSMSSVEGGALVRVTNMETGTTVGTDATAGGSFSLSIAACEGDIFGITATDAAGNESSTTEKTVM